MPISSDFTSILEQEFEINFLQCYPNGSLRHTDLCNIFQITAGLHAEKGGISYADMVQHHQAWVLSRMLLEIKVLPKWKDKVTVKTWIQSLENSRSIRCLELYLNGEKIVGCQTLWAVINTQTRRPDSLLLPHEHFEKFAVKATEQNVEKIEIDSIEDSIANQTVMLSDLDIVNHVNNVKYLEWCLNHENPKRLFSNTLKTIQINFMRELNRNDEAKILKLEEEEFSKYKIEFNGKNCYALELRYL